MNLVPLASYTDPATRGTADDIVLIEAGTGESNNLYIVGAFDTVNYAGEPLTIDFSDEDGISFRSYVDNGLFRNVTYTATTVELQNLLASEGDTDTYDLTQMIMNYTGATGNGKTWITGDIDNDGDTDSYDLTRGIMNFTGARNAATAAPEPSGLLVLAAGCLAVALIGPIKVAAVPAAPTIPDLLRAARFVASKAPQGSKAIRWQCG